MDLREKEEGRERGRAQNFISSGEEDEQYRKARSLNKAAPIYKLPLA